MLKCVLKDDHIVKEPVTSSCGHYICNDCIPDRTEINCKICKKETELHDQIETETAAAKEIIKSSLNELFEAICINESKKILKDQTGSLLANNVKNFHN
jgi:hypothetical protein